MRKRDWIYFVVLPLVAAWGLDRLTKSWAAGLAEPVFKGPVAFMLHHNPGVILGSFADLPPLLRIVSLSTGGMFLIFCFFILQYLIPPGLLTLRTGMSLLLGGILGNVTDRILYGYVIDFIIFRVNLQTSPVFNLADAVQWVGYALVMFSLIRDGKRLWPDQNLRKTFLVNLAYQLKYSFMLSAFALCFSLLAGILSYTFLKVTVAESGMGMLQGSHLLITFSVTFSLVSIAFCLICFFVGFILSHRAAGPIFAFERFLEELYAGHTQGLKLRAGDEFQQLEKLATKLVRKWKEKNSA
jgi:signal peptidase II